MEAQAEKNPKIKRLETFCSQNIKGLKHGSE
jgi:hypothetical protein